jgi:hypothetical protein
MSLAVLGLYICLGGFGFIVVALVLDHRNQNKKIDELHRHYEEEREKWKS